LRCALNTGMLYFHAYIEKNMKLGSDPRSVYADMLADESRDRKS